MRETLPVQKQVFYIQEPWTPHQTKFSILHDLGRDITVFCYDRYGYIVQPTMTVQSETLVQLEFKHLVIDQYTGKTEWRSLQPYIQWPVKVIVCG